MPFIFPLRKKSVLLYKRRMKLLTTKEAAARLGVSVVRVRQLIQDDKLKAERIGRDYAIKEKDLSRVKVYGTVGRPRKAA
jgi:excisionase family DNA binding protein